MKSTIKGLFITALVFCLAPVAIILVAAPFNSTTDADEDFSKSQLLVNKPAVLAEPVDLKIMTYNIANAHGFTTNRRERILAVADLLIELDVDLVGIQEAFVEEERKVLYSILEKSALKYRVEFPAATVGNGIVILSKFPIEESYFYRYKATDSWYKVWAGDWWAGKGIGLARVRLPNGGLIDFYNTHAQAYRGNQSSVDARYKQFVEGADFINASKTGTAPAFFVGDFNTKQSNDDYLYAQKALNWQRVMNIDSRIDHLVAIGNERYSFEVLDTKELNPKVMGSNAGLFFSRAPTLSELWELYYGEPEETFVSDHYAYISQVRINPSSNRL